MEPLYFAFPDGALHYVCAECTAHCCRGHGFGGSLGRETGRILALHPELGHLAVVRRGDLINLANSAGGCHFLDRDNLCRIEKDHGRPAKPTICRLFPFNFFSLIGRTVVVAPHFLCPLRVQAPPRPGEVEGTHAALEPVLRESGLVSEAYVRLSMAPARLHPSQRARSVVAREMAFRDACGAALGGGAFSLVLRDAASDPERLQGNIARAAALWGLPSPAGSAARDDIDDVLLAVALALRLELLRLSADGILLALALGELLVRRVAALRAYPPTPQDVRDTVGWVLPALHLLACADLPLATSARSRRKVPPFGDPAMVFAGHRLLRGVEAGGGILDLLEDAMARLESPADRTAFLVEMGTLVGPSFRRPGRPERHDAGAPQRRSPGAAGPRGSMVKPTG